MSFSPGFELNREIYLFFVMATLDEKISIQSTEKVIAYIKSRFSSEKNQNEVQIRRIALFKAIELWGSFSKQMLVQRQKTNLNKNDKAIAAMNWTNQLVGFSPQMMSVWNKFSRQARPEEAIAILTTRILKFSEADLCEAQNVSLGTIRFRISRAAKLLGAFVEAEA